MWYGKTVRCAPWPQQQYYISVRGSTAEGRQTQTNYRRHSTHRARYQRQDRENCTSNNKNNNNNNNRNTRLLKKRICSLSTILPQPLVHNASHRYEKENFLLNVTNQLHSNVQTNPFTHYFKQCPTPRTSRLSPTPWCSSRGATRTDTPLSLAMITHVQSCFRPASP